MRAARDWYRTREPPPALGRTRGRRVISRRRLSLSERYRNYWPTRQLL